MKPSDQLLARVSAVALLVTGVIGDVAFAAVPTLPPAVDRTIDFVLDVQPIFANNCYGCHGPKKRESSLRLDEKTAALKGGESYGAAAIIPGKSADSVLVQAVAHAHSDLKMPKKGDRLSAEQVGVLRAWIDQGANWPEAAGAAARKDAKDHWAFKAPRRPALPAVKNKKWVRTQIDHFILAKLEKEGLKPSPEADKVTLMRRLYIDLVGLPPGVEEVDAFVADKSPDAYASLVEKLLTSPHYGERWGRHWLDAARYADSDGYEKDMSRDVWAYRDYVVNGFNKDLPYDRFIVE